jgi:hypothetical protein
VDFGIYLIPVFQVHIAGVDDVVSKVLWTNLFIEAQNNKVNTNIIYQDNTSSMKLEENGKAKDHNYYSLKQTQIQSMSWMTHH